MGLSNLFGGSQPMQSIPGATPVPDIPFPDGSPEATLKPFDGIPFTAAPTFHEQTLPGFTPDEATFAPVEPEDTLYETDGPVETAGIEDSNCPSGYKLVIIYVPEDIPASQIPGLHVGEDGKIPFPEYNDGERPDWLPVFPENRPPFEPTGNPRVDLNPFINPDILDKEKMSKGDPYLTITPDDTELPASITGTPVGAGDLTAPNQSWLKDFFNKIKESDVDKRLQEIGAEIRAKAAERDLGIADEAGLGTSVEAEAENEGF